MKMLSAFGNSKSLVGWIALLLSVIALLVPLSGSQIVPGYSPTVLFDDPLFVITYLASLLLVGILWSKHGESRAIAAFLVVLYSLLTIELWPFKTPGGNPLLGWYYYGIKEDNTFGLTNNILQTGHLSFQGLQSWPSIFIIAVECERVVGSNLGSAIATLDIIRAILTGLFSFLLIRHFVISPKLAVVGTFLALISWRVILVDTPFTLANYGVLFFFVITLLLLRLKAQESKHLITISLLMAACVITFPLSSFIAVIMVLFFAHKSKNHWLLPTSLLSIILFLSWVAFAAISSVEMFGIGNVIMLIFGEQNSLATQGIHSGLFFYFFQVLNEYVTSLPWGLGYFPLFWFFFVYVIGTLSWLLLKLRKTRSIPQTSVMAPILLTTIPLVLSSPSGGSWTRILFYLPPFLAVAMLTIMGCSNVGRRSGAVIALVLFLTMPTIVSYNETGSYTMAVYPQEVSAGGYLDAHFTLDNIYFGSGVVTLNYSLWKNFILGITSSPFTPSQSDAYVTRVLQGFADSTSGSILITSPLFFLEYAHLFGQSSADVVQFEVYQAVISSDLVYTNGFTTISYAS